MAELLDTAPPLPRGRRVPALLPNLDHGLMMALAALLALGLVMVASASVTQAADSAGQPLHYLQRQLGFAGLAVLAVAAALRLPLGFWQRLGVPLLGLTCLLLALVLLPGVGVVVNGAARWLPVGPFQFQVSELFKLAVILYVAGHLARHGEYLRQPGWRFMAPLVALLPGVVLLLLEPDFGGAVVVVATALGLVFLGGAPLGRLSLVVGLCAGLAASLVATSHYRLARITAFLDPWADPFDSGFQLTQSLIAIGRGQWFGVGLGNSVQKLFYLPEAHTDFLFAVLAEELGLAGVLVLIALFGFVVWRAFAIGRGCLRQERPFAAFAAYGIGLWLGLQAIINMGVNMGLLPTKGITLPLLSYGGSSLLVTGLALGILLRADHERRVAAVAARPVSRGDRKP